MASKVHVREAELLNVYKKAYNTKIPLQEVLDAEFFQWITLYEKATSCSETVVVANLLAMTTFLCWPRTDVVTVANGGFRTTLNQYLLSVCDPSGGISYVFTEEDTENVLPDSQSNSTIVTSKDTQHILRLATVLHILQRGVNGTLLNNNEAADEAAEPTEIPVIRLKQASKLYFTLQQHKNTFGQASMETVKNKLKLRPVKTFQERLVKAVCTLPGPVLLLRTLQRHIKGALAENSRHELEYMERNGFGALKVLNSRPYFIKIPPQYLDDEVGSQIQIMK